MRTFRRVPALDAKLRALVKIGDSEPIWCEATQESGGYRVKLPALDVSSTSVSVLDIHDEHGSLDLDYVSAE